MKEERRRKQVRKWVYWDRFERRSQNTADIAYRKHHHHTLLSTADVRKRKQKAVMKKKGNKIANLYTFFFTKSCSYNET